VLFGFRSLAGRIPGVVHADAVWPNLYEPRKGPKNSRRTLVNAQATGGAIGPLQVFVGFQCRMKEKRESGRVHNCPSTTTFVLRRRLGIAIGARY